MVLFPCFRARRLGCLGRGQDPWKSAEVGRPGGHSRKEDLPGDLTW